MVISVKLAVVGPQKSGKSVLSNFLADATEWTSGDYHPTRGVRILEFEVPDLSIDGRSYKIDVELWDCSGDKKYESCWPVITRDSQGILLVYNPHESKHYKDLDYYFSHFAKNVSSKESNCCLVANHQQVSNRRSHQQLSHQYVNLPSIDCSLEEDAKAARKGFEHFLSQLVSAMNKHRAEEEASILSP